MYLVGWLFFLTLEKCPFVEDILRIPGAHSLLVTRAVTLGVSSIWAVCVLLL